MISAEPDTLDLQVASSIAHDVGMTAGCICQPRTRFWASWRLISTTVDGEHRLLELDAEIPAGTLAEKVLAAAVAHVDADCPALALVGQPQTRTVDPAAPVVVVVTLPPEGYLDLTGQSFETA